jgi:hypothetical protein
MLFLDENTFAVVNSLVVVVVLHCWIRVQSPEHMLFFFLGRKYRSHIPCSYLVPAKGYSRGSLRRQILRTGLAVGHPCLRLAGVHHGHQVRVPWDRIVLQVGPADRSHLSVQQT